MSGKSALIRTLAQIAITAALTTSPVHAARLVYSGVLEVDGKPANGPHDILLTAYTSVAGAVPKASPVEFHGVDVKEGRFELSLDLPGEAGEAWVELAVREAGGTVFVPLLGRSKAALAPEAIGQCWSSTGDAGSDPSTNFLGTLDAQPLVLRTANAQSLRIEPSAATFGSPALPITTNTIGGSHANQVTTGVRGATISGGGLPLGDSDPDHPLDAPNQVTDDFGTVSGGYGNLAGDDTGTTQDSSYATIGGGFGNSASGGGSVVGGGQINQASGGGSTVSGGGGNTAGGQGSFVGGGYDNTANGNLATVAGGRLNAAGISRATVGGGASNTASGVVSTVAGGEGNTASGWWSLVGGGASNTASGEHGTVGGGEGNGAGGEHATVSGGFINRADANLSTVGGGGANGATGVQSTIGGGWSNNATQSGSTVAGGFSNNANGTHSTISGGFWNTASRPSSTVSGGDYNTASEAWSVVGGGDNNMASGTGSSVLGGGGNTASGVRSTVAGGELNCAGGFWSWAGGRQVKVRPGTGASAPGTGCDGVPSSADADGDNGTFAWADSQDVDFVSNGPNQFLVRAQGGIFFGTNSTVSLPAGRFINTSTGAHLTTGGTWTNASSRSFKSDFVAVDPLDVLGRVLRLGISTWAYRESPEGRHMGPVAEDFHALFGLGTDEASISTVDASGVAIAAIQGLNQKLEAERDALKAENDELRARLDRLERIVLETD